MSQQQPQEIELDFEKFATQLFNQTPCPQPNTNIVNIDFQDESSNLDFLQDLFKFGVFFKFPNQKNFTMENFELIRDYIRAIGYETILQAYEKDTVTNEISRVNLTFKHFTES